MQDKMKKRIEELWEVNLPQYLQNDIAAYKKEVMNESSLLLDCYWCELYGSINSAQYDNEITKEQADYLRHKYLGLENES